MSTPTLFLTWLVTLLAVAGSLFFSEVMHFPPCVLCWYQRIPMFSLAVVLATAVYFQDRKVLRYAFPLWAMGMAIASYHILVYYHLVPERITPCSEGVSCSERQINWFGFVSIPLLSLSAFTLVGMGLFKLKKENRSHE